MARRPAKPAPAAPEDSSQAETGSGKDQTRALLADLALRGGAMLARKIIDRRLTAMKYSPAESTKILAGQGFTRAAASAAAARLGLKALPGSLLIGGVVLAKTLYDRKRKKAGKVARDK